MDVPFVMMQELGEKIALKLCRLELNSKNRDRWSREIQIMKKCVQIIVTHELGYRSSQVIFLICSLPCAG